MGTEPITQEIPRVVDGPGGRHGLLPHDAVFATAMARIEALSTGWQEILADFGTGTPTEAATGTAPVAIPAPRTGGTGRHAAPHEPADAVAPAATTTPGIPAETPADIPANEAAALAARAEASRWRRSLAA